MSKFNKVKQLHFNNTKFALSLNEDFHKRFKSCIKTMVINNTTIYYDATVGFELFFDKLSKSLTKANTQFLNHGFFIIPNNDFFKLMDLPKDYTVLEIENLLIYYKDIDYRITYNLILKAKLDMPKATLDLLAHYNREYQLETSEYSKKFQQNFNQIWDNFKNNNQEYTFIIGPTNSGKTYHALQELSQTKDGVYLAPLRLLAWEIYETLNIQYYKPTSLKTGEEEFYCNGQEVVSSTIEMFDRQKSYDLVVIDEFQMAAEKERGWAWTQALLNAKSKKVIIIGSENIKQFLVDLFTNLGKPYNLIETQRKTDLVPYPKKSPFITAVPKHSIIIAFSRNKVLEIDKKLSDAGRKSSVIYGALPPEVRRKQAEDFITGKTEICVATDAIAMGLNLPCEYIWFSATEKFNGISLAELSETEVKQIAGRAGRFGMFPKGYYGGIDFVKTMDVKELYQEDPNIISQVVISPTVEDIEGIETGNNYISDKLNVWATNYPIPEKLRNLFLKCKIDFDLAQILDKRFNQLSISDKFTFIKVPIKKDTTYWFNCVSAIYKNLTIPLPDKNPTNIESGKDLSDAEALMGNLDIYGYIANRKNFKQYCPDLENIMVQKKELAEMIHNALVKKVGGKIFCECCGVELHSIRFKKCDLCFQASKNYNEDDE